MFRWRYLIDIHREMLSMQVAIHVWNLGGSLLEIHIWKLLTYLAFKAMRSNQITKERVQMKKGGELRTEHCNISHYKVDEKKSQQELLKKSDERGSRKTKKMRTPERQVRKSSKEKGMAHCVKCCCQVNDLDLEIRKSLMASKIALQDSGS